MAVFVDNTRAPFGRMIMCHMFADSTEELREMAAKIGVARKWEQKTGTVYEHYDICLSRRTEAVKAGAIEVTQRDFALKVRIKREILVSNSIKNVVVSHTRECSYAHEYPKSHLCNWFRGRFWQATRNTTCFALTTPAASLPDTLAIVH